jgi:hypothetical protein
MLADPQTCATRHAPTGRAAPTSAARPTTSPPYNRTPPHLRVHIVPMPTMWLAWTASLLPRSLFKPCRPPRASTHCPFPPLSLPRRAPLPGCLPYPRSSPPATPIPTEALPAAGLSPRSANSPEQTLPWLPIHGTAELPRRSTSRRLQPHKSTLGESLSIPGHFPGQFRPSLGRIPAIPSAGRA